MEPETDEILQPPREKKRDDFVNLLDFSDLDSPVRREPGSAGRKRGQRLGREQRGEKEQGGLGNGVGKERQGGKEQSGPGNGDGKQRGRGKEKGGPGRGEGKEQGGGEQGETAAQDRAFKAVEREFREFEMRFGSRYLQLLGVFVISIAFSILGYYPSSTIPVWGQVAFMFLGAGILILFGEILIERKEMEFYALGLIFAGIKLIYSSFWSLFNNFDLIDATAFTAALVLTLGFHYGASVRYHSAVLNASFVLLSWLPLVMLHDLYPNDEIILILFLLILAADYAQAHVRKEATALMVVPATALLYLFLNAGGHTIYDFTFNLDPVELVLIPIILVFIILTLLVLSYHYDSKTLLSDYLKDFPGTTFAHLTSLFLVLAVLVTYPLLSAPIFLFLMIVVFSALILVHFHKRGEELILLSAPISAALLTSLGPLAATLFHELLLLPLSICLLFSAEIISRRFLDRRNVLPLHRQLIRGCHIILAGIVLLVWFQFPDRIEFLPALFLLIAIATQLFLSYSYIRHLHIITGELILLIISGAYGWSSGDGVGYSASWVILFLVFGVIAHMKKNGDLASKLFLLLGVDLLLTSNLYGRYVILPAILLVPSLFLLSRWYSGPYFLHKLQNPVNDISLILKKYRIVDLYNITLILSFAISVITINMVAEAWMIFPLTTALYLHTGLENHRGKLVLPLLTLVSGVFLIYFGSLLLLVYLTLFPTIILFLYIESPNPRIDHYLQMILFLTVGLSVGIDDLKGSWLWDVLALDRSIRLTLVYLFYLFALGSFVAFSRRYSALLFTGLVALGELSALLMFTFEYQYGIQLYMSIMFILMVYFGLYLIGHIPQVHTRTWVRDRTLLQVVAVVLYFLPVILINYRNDLPEYESWFYGICGILLLFVSDILRNGLHLERLREGPNSDLQGLTPTEHFSLFIPTLLCMNYSEDYSLWVFLLLFTSVLIMILFRDSRSRLHSIVLYGLIFFLPFNVLLFAGDIGARSLHLISDLIPLGLVFLYVFTFLPDMTNNNNPLTRHLFSKLPDYSSTTSLAILILGTFSCSHFGMVVMPIAMFLFCFWRKDVIATPASYVTFMLIFYLYFALTRGEIDTAMNGLLFLSLLPIFIALLNESLYKVKALTFSFSTLSFMLMFGVPWFAGGGSYVGTVITNVIWTIFGGTAFSAGFYLNRLYLRFFGIFFLVFGIFSTAYNTYILGYEAVAVSLLVFGLIAMIASYFYYLHDTREEARKGDG